MLAPYTYLFLTHARFTCIISAPLECHPPLYLSLTTNAVVDMAMVLSPSTPSIGAMSVFRAVRLLRVLRLARSWKSLNRWGWWGDFSWLRTSLSS